MAGNPFPQRFEQLRPVITVGAEIFTDTKGK
jgi:hypothetical protein